jgi:hypothetical protein
MKIFTLLLMIIPVLGFSQTTNLLISEYGEGAGGNKKYIEIYNGTPNTVDLANYELWKTVNGGMWNFNAQGTTATLPLSLSGNLASGSTYVIAHNVTDVPGADLYNNSWIAFNGNDAIGLAWNGGAGTTFTLLDVFGFAAPDQSQANTANFTIAGITDASVDKVLIRKASVCSPTTNWDLSRGTDVTSSQWDVSVLPYNNDNAATVTANLGQHSANCAAAPCSTIPAPAASAVSVCKGLTATLTATASVNGSTLSWFNLATGGTAIGTGTSFTTGTLTATTSFWVEEAVTGCPESARTEVIVTVNDLPTVSTTVNGNTITALPTGATYQWIDCNNTNTPEISGATSISYSASATGSYAVTVTNTNGCSATSTCVDITVSQVGINTLQSDIVNTVFPNPTKGKVTLNLPSTETATVTVYNALGKIVYSFNNAQNGTIIDLSSNQTGIYMIQISTEKESNIYRIVKR